MAISEAKVSSATADGAREELQEYNHGAIAAAKASGTSLPLDLKAPDSLAKLQKAYSEFRTAFQELHPEATLRHPRPVLFLSRPPMHKASLHGVSACLALGKIGGGDAEELNKGHAFVWEEGEKQEFGDVDAIYVGFKVEQLSA